MPHTTTTPRTRRQLLALALAGGAATAAATLRPAMSLAANGDLIEIGATNVGTAVTALNATVDDRTFSARNLSNADHAVALAGFVATGSGEVAHSAAVYGLTGQVGGYGVWGNSNVNLAKGVIGTVSGDNAVGVEGTASGVNGIGVYGESRGGRGAGVRAYGSSHGIHANGGATGIVGVGNVEFLGQAPAEPLDLEGDGLSNTGVYGLTAGGDGSGVVGSAQTGRGVVGRSESGYGVHGSASAAGGTGVAGIAAAATGVHAQTTTGTGLFAESLGEGLALRASGRARFSSSGAAAVPKGARIRTLTNVDAPANCKILVTLNQDPGPGNGVLMARRLSSTSIRVKLAKPAARRVRFSYFILV